MAEEKKRIIVGRQNETLRRRQGDSVGLAVLDLTYCIAVAITNSKGEASLTHVTPFTNLNFIKEEFELMGNGALIHFIRSSESVFFNTLFNGKNKDFVPKAAPFQLYRSSTMCVLVDDNNQIIFPIKIQLEHFSKNGTFTESEKARIAVMMKSPAYLAGKDRFPALSEDAETDFGVEFILRDQVAQIESAFSPSINIRIIYDNKDYLTTAKNITLSAKTAEEVKNLRSRYENSIRPKKMEERSLKEFLFLIFKEKNYYLQREIDTGNVNAANILNILPSCLLSYWEYQDRQKAVLAPSESKKGSVASVSSAIIHIPNPEMDVLKKKMETALKKIVDKNWGVDIKKNQAILMLDSDRANKLAGHLSECSINDVQIIARQNNQSFVIIKGLDLSLLEKAKPFEPDLNTQNQVVVVTGV